MIIKEVSKLPALLPAIILPVKKNKIFTFKIDKSIEIVVVSKPRSINSHQENVGIILEEKKILKILLKRYKHVLITKISTERDLQRLVTRKPDLVFSGVKYFLFKEKTIWLNDYLDQFHIPYIASSVKALGNESDKNKAKKIIKMKKIDTADFFVTNPGEYLTKNSVPIKFPLFIKPVIGGDSRGVDKNSIVFNFKNFVSKVLDIKNKQNSSSLVETYLSGKEYSVGIFEDSIDGSLVAMPIEIIVKKNSNGHCILDFDIKKNDEEKVIAVSDNKIFNQLSKIAKKSFKALGGKSLGRIDFKMDHKGVPHFIEANLMPGLLKGYFYRACKLNLNISYDEMILRIANNGLASN
jgi:D-alanine-D-alanine ligase